MIKTQGGRRLEGVDLLRGLAIFFVLMNHVNMRLRIAGVPYTQGLPRQLVSSLVWNGQLGVQMFFAISGFLITTMSMRRWGALPNIHVREFYWLRVARIAPLLLLLLAVLSALHLAHVKNFVVSPKVGGLGSALFAALTFHVNVLEAQRGYLPANWDILWSLSVEEVFYLAFPLACWLLARSKVFVGLLLVLVAMGPVARTVLSAGNDVWNEYSYLGGMDAIAMGCLTAMLAGRMSLSPWAVRIVAAAGGVLVVFSLCFSLTANQLGLVRTGLAMTVLALGTCLLVMVAAQLPWQSPKMLKPLSMLGARSYEVYLTHMFVVFGFFELFLGAGKPMSAVPWLFVAVILAASLLGWAVARFYSEPVNDALRRRFIAHRETIAHFRQDRQA